jgi:CMP/dCMP kinase
MAVITVSRQYGSGGDEIVARVCGLLGYGYFDKRLIARVAADVGLAEGEAVDLTEDDYKVRSFLARLLNRSGRSTTQVRSWHEDASGARVAEVKPLDEDQAAALVKQAIEAAGRQGDILIVGRGGQVVLGDKPGVLHVRIEAPVAIRVQCVAEAEHVSPGQAESTVVARDKAAAGYLRRFHDVDWADTSLYHLVINTGKCDLETAASLIVCAARSVGAQ